MIKKTICSKCKKNPPHRGNQCKECLREYARKRYEDNYRAEPPEEEKNHVRPFLWGLQRHIRSKTSIRKSLSAKFGAQPEKKYNANDIRKAQ